MSATTLSIASAPAPALRARYVRGLAWAFTLFNSARVLAYLPTLWAIHATGDSTQHSLWTWCLWLGANGTMAAWMFEQNGHRIDKPVAVNACNTAMCALVSTVIAIHRF